MVKLPNKIIFLFILLCGFVIAGCSGQDDMSELKKYVIDVKARKPSKIESTPQFKTSEQYTYPTETRRSPFMPIKRQVAQNTGRSSSIYPDTKREREPLEMYPLDALRMVGTLMQGEKTWAMVVTPEGTITRITIGEHLGRNFGRISKITEKEMQIVETIPEGDGWKYRLASLALMEEE